MTRARCSACPCRCWRLSAREPAAVRRERDQAPRCASAAGVRIRGKRWNTQLRTWRTGSKAKPSNKEYDTLQVDIKALPFKSNTECTRLWLNGQEIRNVESLDISAGVGNITTVTIKFRANVALGWIEPCRNVRPWRAGGTADATA